MVRTGRLCYASIATLADPQGSGPADQPGGSEVGHDLLSGGAGPGRAVQQRRESGADSACPEALVLGRFVAGTGAKWSYSNSGSLQAVRRRVLTGLHLRTAGDRYQLQ